MVRPWQTAQIRQLWQPLQKFFQAPATNRMYGAVQVGKVSRFLRHRPQQSAIFLIAVASLTGTLGQRFYNQPELDVGRVAPYTILAPQAATVEDRKTTEEQRKAAETGQFPILEIDSAANQQIYQDLQRILTRGDDLRKVMGPFPVVPVSQLSLSTQMYLRDAPSSDWDQVVQQVAPRQLSLRESVVSGTEAQPATPQVNSTTRQRAVSELQAYRQGTFNQDLRPLLEQLFTARQRYQAAQRDLAEQTKPTESAASAIVPPLYQADFFNLTDTTWQETKAGTYTALERILTQGIPQGFPPRLLERTVRLQTSLAVPAASEPLVVDMLKEVIKPNLITDAEQTKLQAEQAVQAVEPAMVSIGKGEAIVRAGDTITQSQFVLLDHFNMSERAPNWLGLAGFSGWITVGTLVFVVVSTRFQPRMRRRDHLLILGLSIGVAISTPALLQVRWLTPALPSVGILLGSFYGSTLGAVTVGLLSITMGVGLEIGVGPLLPSATSAFVAAIIAGRLRSREEYALLGAGVGLTQALVHLLVSLAFTSVPGEVWYALFQSAMLYGCVGVGWSILALGISPYLEHLFDLITPIRLAELANPNRPLLQRLAAEAPGTFQHTLFVSTLAEAAARALRCNVELVRAGTLYHDIGKMHDPQGFIENQMGGMNKHEKIDDPWKSATIIKKHVSEGLVMARKYRLPRAIRAFIPEHQGTMLISFFHHRAQQLAAEHPEQYKISECDFRYDGPIPQTRETGIVMLADSCEAALRSLKDATPQDALNMVKKIIRARWQDNQLIHAGLKREELETIAAVFVQIWQQFHHKRIPYPSSSPTPSNPGKVFTG
ncbi:MAG: HDIG domain-containing metalloprotein [Cyanobacteria bacterium P01_H01_bin.121]